MKTQNKIHYGALDGLRAYSAIGVAMMHILSNGKYKVSGFVFDPFIQSLGNLVFLFMMISAFSMCCGYYDRLINQEISVIGIGWFLGLIFVFYMIFPFFCYLISNRNRAWGTFIISMIFNVICRIYFFDNNHVISGFDVRGNIIYSAMFFMLGGILFLYKNSIYEFCQKKKILIALLTVIIAGIYFYQGKSEPFIMLVLFGLLLIYSIASQNNTGKILSNKFTKFIGNISLEIYLCHMVFYRMIEKVHMNHLFGNEILSYIVTVIMTLACAIIFSCVVKYLLEKMMQKKL